MKREKLKIVLLTLFIAGFCGISWAQNVERYRIEAEDAFQAKNYYAAYYYITQYIENLEEDDIEVEFFAGEAARHYKAFGYAAKHFSKVVDMERNGEYPLASLWLGDMHMRLGQYDTAAISYELYLAENEGDNAYFSDLAKKRLESCEWAGSNILSKADIYQLERLGDGINTSFSEVAPYFINDKLHFSSLRFENPKDKHRPRRPLSKIMYSEDLEFALLSEDLNSDELYHYNNLQYDSESGLLYYSKCHYEEGEVISCELYRRTLDEEIGPELALSSLNSDSFTTTQPTIGMSPDGKQKTLYFVSNRPGGKGGMDIWYTLLNADGTPDSEPINMVRLNTAGDEMTPYYHLASKSLFFSSDYYIGFGGQDVFRVTFDKFGKVGEPKNLGSPLNTSFDDIYFVVDEDEEIGYLSSNRLESNFLDTSAEACCFDIYEVDIDNIVTLKALTFDKKTRLALSQCDVSLYADGNLVQMLHNPDSNDFYFALDRNVDYTLIGSRPEFISDTLTFDTRAVVYGDTIEKKLYLERENLYLDLCVFDAATRERLLGSGITIKDLTTGEIIYSDILELDNCDRIKVLPGHNYRIDVGHEGYKPEVVNLNIPLDANEDIKKDVYLKKWTLEELLPLVVYFNNDIPDPRVTSRKTKAIYSETFDEYALAQSFFMTFVDEIYPELEYTQAKNRIENFFNDEVIPAKDRFDQLKIVLKDELEKGKKITIGLDGYASRRANMNYNNKLSSRRNNSVVNDFEAALDGYFKDYLKSGQLKFVKTPYGSSTAPEYPENIQHKEIYSIYSVEASKERRVQLQLISIE